MVAAMLLCHIAAAALLVMLKAGAAATALLITLTAAAVSAAAAAVATALLITLVAAAAAAFAAAIFLAAVRCALGAYRATAVPLLPLPPLLLPLQLLERKCSRPLTARVSRIIACGGRRFAAYRENVIPVDSVRS